MATVALPQVGANRTIPADWSRWTSLRVAMLTRRMSHRVSQWARLEPEADIWASYGALTLGAVGTVVAILAVPLF